MSDELQVTLPASAPRPRAHLVSVDINVKHARVHDVKVVALVALANDGLARADLALKHGVDLPPTTNGNGRSARGKHQETPGAAAVPKRRLGPPRTTSCRWSRSKFRKSRLLAHAAAIRIRASLLCGREGGGDGDRSGTSGAMPQASE